ncbi:MAG: murein biosynthesis integral membrane protein MurJ [Chloroflexi bacterium]|nr:murein biosynthesis integral membrane protein MurJ [Chloroflexota bacterium]
MMLGTALSRLLGLVREQVIAGLFGTTAVTSAFITASGVPTMVYDLLIGGAVSAALVPVFSDYAGDDDGLGEVASSIALLALVLLVAIAMVLALFAPVVVWALGATTDATVYEQTVAMVRWLLPAVVFLGFSGVSSALLYARRQFAYPAFAIAAFNAGIIVAAVALAPLLGPGSLVVGVLAGAILQCIAQWPALRRLRWRLRLDLGHPGVRRIIALYAPVAGGLVVTIVGIAIDRNLAWRTGEDSVAVMRFATTLVQLPLGLVGTALSFAILPTLTRLAGEHDDAYRGTLAQGIRLAVLAMLPATVGLTLLREPVVALLFERGVFDPTSTARTAGAFLLYAPQMPFVAVDQLLVVAFYARKNTLTPMLVGVLGVSVYVAVGLTLIGPGQMGLSGLVMANTAQHIVHAVVLFVLLRRATGSLHERPLGGAVLRATAAVGLAGGVAWLVGATLPAAVDVPSRLLLVGIAGAAFAGVYAAAVVVLGVTEARQIAGRLCARLNRGMK